MHMLTKIGRVLALLACKEFPLCQGKTGTAKRKIKFPWQCQRKETGTTLSRCDEAESVHFFQRGRWEEQISMKEN